MARKKVTILQNHEEAERYVLEKGFARTHEERMRWLYRQLEIMRELNPDAFVREPEGYVLKKKGG